MKRYSVEVKDQSDMAGPRDYFRGYEDSDYRLDEDSGGDLCRYEDVEELRMRIDRAAAQLDEYRCTCGHGEVCLGCRVAGALGL